MKLKVRFTPTGWLLAGIGGLLVVAFVAALVVNMVVATRISTSRNADDSYTWTGGTLVLENTRDDRAAGCDITPDDGEARHVTIDRKRTTGFTKTSRYQEFEPWFTGSARITCSAGSSTSGGVNVWSGGTATLHNLVESGPLRLLGVVLVVLTLGVALVFFRADRAKKS
jgi:hypothetical protein